MQPTIKDVARLSGVSIGTVDRVLHNRGRVSRESQESVLKAVKELDYHPSQIARALVSRKNPITLGITYPMVDQDFWLEAKTGIDYACSKLEKLGIRLLVDSFPTYSIKDQIASIDKLLQANVDGIILTAVDDSFSEKIDKHIPENIPYATVINDTVGSRRIFFLGPDDFALGRLMAKLVHFYIPSNCNVAILAPNASFTGTQQRISGFLSKVNQDSLDIHIQRVFPVESDDSEEIIYQNMQDAVKTCLKNHSNLNAIYVTNGLIEQAAAALESSGRAGDILMFGHEYTANMKYYIENDIITASLYQKPASEWYQAICMLCEHLTGEREIEKSVYSAECSVIIKETLPFIKFGEIEIF